MISEQGCKFTLKCALLLCGRTERWVSSGFVSLEGTWLKARFRLLLYERQTFNLCENQKEGAQLFQQFESVTKYRSFVWSFFRLGNFVDRESTEYLEKTSPGVPSSNTVKLYFWKTERIEKNNWISGGQNKTFFYQVILIALIELLNFEYRRYLCVDSRSDVSCAASVTSATFPPPPPCPSNVDVREQQHWVFGETNKSNLHWWWQLCKHILAQIEALNISGAARWKMCFSFQFRSNWELLHKTVHSCSFD